MNCKICEESLQQQKKRYSKCTKCGTVHIFSSKMIKPNYDSGYQKRGSGIKYLISTMQGWFDSFYFARLLAEKKSLDFGCGNGAFFKFYKARGYDIEGYDPNYFYKPSLLKFKYDVIFCYHVLEHTDNPIKVLNKIYSMLKPDGLLILKTPNAESVEFLIAGSSWFHFDFPFHNFLFSEYSLKTALLKCNFKRIDTKVTFEFPQSLGYSLLRMSSLPIGLLFAPLSILMRFFKQPFSSPVIEIWAYKSVRSRVLSTK